MWHLSVLAQSPTRMIRRTHALTLLAVLLLACPSPACAWDWGLQCVPFARGLSRIAIFGDAWQWWSKAAGRYERGHIPQAGSVLSFQPNLRMPLGHVGVVTRIVGAREIEIDHANWTAGTISRSVEVVDVSDGNDWTAVRVQLGRSDYFGQVYATDGFIYGRPVDIGPQIIDVAMALQTSSPYMVQVADALRSKSAPQIIDVAEFLRSHGAGEPLSRAIPLVAQAILPPREREARNGRVQ